MTKLINNTICISLLSGIMAISAMYINSKINNKKNNTGDYIKLFILVLVIVYSVQVYNIEKGDIQMTGGSYEDLDLNIDDPQF